MSAAEYRRCPFTGQRAALAPLRAERPGATPRSPEPPDDPAACPFCEGHEAETPPERFADRGETPANGPGWRVRAFPNRYPAMAAGTNADGRHEVIVAAPHHATTLGSLDEMQLRRVLAAYADRLRSFAAEPRWRTRLVIHNQGAAAGASQRHVHSQAFALPFVGPTDPQQWGAFTVADPVGAAMAKEQAEGVRIVAANGAALAWCPYASAFPGEVWIAPMKSQPRFEDADPASAASLLLATIRAVETEAPAFNMMLHTAPPGHAGRWFFRILPRTAGIAGFELATGIAINPVAPEAAAARLRERIALLPPPDEKS